MRYSALMREFSFKVLGRGNGSLARAGLLHTPHGDIETPAFVPVSTKATLKALTPEQLLACGAQVTLANTYHLHLQPGENIVREGGGLHSFMNWSGPMMTDSGGFQVFSLGAAFGKGVSKFGQKEDEVMAELETAHTQAPAKVDEEGVTFKSYIDGSAQRLTPESSVEIQQALGADIIFVFDEPTAPLAPPAYQREALERTHRWAKRSLSAHQRSPEHSQKQALFGIVQGGRDVSLREESARFISSLEFDGFGIGGSYTKDDIQAVVGPVNQILPEDRPRHILGIGEVADLFAAVENGCDLFDCVTPTRMGRNGTLMLPSGRLNIYNARYERDFAPVMKDCDCYTCTHYTRAYLAHLFRAKEMLAGTLASIHNLRLLIRLVDGMRQAIGEGKFQEFKKETLAYSIPAFSQ